MLEGKRRYTMLDVGLTGLFFHIISIRIVPLLPQWITANSVTALGAFGCLIIMLLLISRSPVSGILILSVLFLDFLDGAIANYRNAASQFGKVFDGTVDLLFWLAILIGLFISGLHALTMGLLTIYAIDISWRLLLGHSTSITDHGGNRYTSSTVVPNAFKRIKPYVYPFVNYYDSICALSMVLILAQQHVSIWLWYEIVRRILLLLKKFREIWCLYSSSRRKG